MINGDRVNIDYDYLINDLKRDNIIYYKTVERNGYIYNVFTEKWGRLIMINVVSYVKELIYNDGVTDIEFKSITLGSGYKKINEKILQKESIRLIDKMYNVYQKQ